MADPSGPTRAEGPDHLENPKAAVPAESAAPDDAAPGPAATTNGSPREPGLDTPAPAPDVKGEDAGVAPETTIIEPNAAEPTTTEPTTAEPAEAEAPVEAAPAVGQGSWPGSAPADVADVHSAKTERIDTADGDGSEEGDDLEPGDGDGDGDRDRSGARGGLLDKQIQLNAKTIVLAVGFLALAVGAYFLGQRQAKDDEPAAQPRTTASTAFKQPTEYVRFTDNETGIKLSYPKDWVQRSTKEMGPEGRLLVGAPGTDDTLLVRANAYSKEVTAENLGDQKTLIDALFAAEKVTILGVEAGDLKGMPVLVYVYRFIDADTGRAGIHSHYFVFQGRKAVQMVFQALPEDHYTSGGLGAVWGKISESLEVSKDPPPAFLDQLAGTTPTAPGATTAPSATTAPPTSAPPATG